jgi:hypothetical protein
MKICTEFREFFCFLFGRIDPESLQVRGKEKDSKKRDRKVGLVSATFPPALEA